MSAHPTVKQLEMLAQGGLDNAEAAAVQAHVAACAECGAVHEECTANLPWERDLRAAAQARGEETEVWTPVGEPVRPRFTAGLRADVVEGYTLRFPELGEGGQGVVYQAVQQFPSRKVAIKFLREGTLASTSARRRFEREIAIAAELKHPNIVTILDSGVLADGRRYCVMEYVRGLPLTEYVRENRLSPTETLELFGKVCDAVNYAHQRGIIHRDLKPSNILVDAHGNVKVLDFGLARTMMGATDTDVSTTGQIVGAPAYLSPEQTRGNPDEIDIRSDVYTLGIILYELLTGGFPYKIEGEWPDLISRIREAEPTPPSRAWTLDSGIRPKNRYRSTRRTRCPIDRDLETIILVCLRKERERRYQSAGDLARDIRRYLAGQTITVRPDSLWYVLRKKIARHRMAVLAASTIMLVIAVALFMLARQRLALAEQRRDLERSEAREVMAMFVADHAGALSRAHAAVGPVRRQLVQLVREKVRSGAFTDRIEAARSGLFLDPSAFWTSVDGGELWTDGEWLELCDVQDPATRKHILALMAEKATGGTDRQKYVAFCLIGQLASKGSDVADLCARAVESESHTGVVAAARWASARLGKAVAWPDGNAHILSDEISGLTFVRIPSCDDFKPGSPPSEADRHPDEDQPQAGEYIRPFHLSVTEVTTAAFVPFLKDPAGAQWIPVLVAELFRPDVDTKLKTALLNAARPEADPGDVRRALAMLMFVPDTDASNVPVGYVSLDTARRYCEWLNERAAGAGLQRTYRLPGEAEWEYACRAGNAGRFCYGQDARYLPRFAGCNGNREFHLAGQWMPSFFGLSDMHGGLWELCDSRYPPEHVTDPDARNEVLFVQRGGGFYSPAVCCRCAQRNYTAATALNHYTGVRLLMENGQP